MDGREASSSDNFGRGERVQIWSAAQNAWIEGRVDQVLDENVTREDGSVLPLGSLRVATAKSVMFVPPSKAVEALRKVSDEAALITVVRPGAGTKANKASYQELKEDRRFRVHVLGGRVEGDDQNYDRYPEYWDGGSKPPNLESFADDLVEEGLVARSDCIIAGSRGGQVVIPAIWRALASTTPPVLVINGGCAMTLPGPSILWPRDAVTILVLGGDDYFRAGLTPKEYVLNSRRMVPKGNKSTAILYISEMEHMPQSRLMKVILRPLILAAIYWKASARPPTFELREVCRDLQCNGWNGQLSFLDAGGNWMEQPFGEHSAKQPDSPQGRKVSPKRRSSITQAAIEQEESTVRELEKKVETAEKELLALRSNLANSREKVRQLKEAAVRATAANKERTGTPSPASPSSTVAAGASKLQKGQALQYFSISHKGWVECIVTQVRADGAIQINVKPDTWISVGQQKTLIRMPKANAACRSASPQPEPVAGFSATPTPAGFPSSYSAGASHTQQGHHSPAPKLLAPPMIGAVGEADQSPSSSPRRKTLPNASLSLGALKVQPVVMNAQQQLSQYNHSPQNASLTPKPLTPKNSSLSVPSAWGHSSSKCLVSTNSGSSPQNASVSVPSAWGHSSSKCVVSTNSGSSQVAPVAKPGMYHSNSSFVDVGAAKRPPEVVAANFGRSVGYYPSPQLGLQPAPPVANVGSPSKFSPPTAALWKG